MTPEFVLLLGALLVGLSKGGLGGPMPVALVAPLMSTAMPVPQAVGLVLPLLLLGDLIAVRMYWRRWDSRQMRLLLPGGVLGTLMGAAMLAVLPEDVLRVILALLSLLVVLYKIGSGLLRTIRYQPRDWHAYVFGWTSGFGSGLANSGAPPFTAYMLLQEMPPVPFIGTATLFFFIVNLLKVPGYLQAGIIDLPRLWGTAWVIPLVPVGAWLGRWLIQRLDPRIFEWLMILLLIVVSGYLLISTLT